MRKKPVRFTPEEADAIEKSIERRKLFFKTDVAYRDKLDDLIREIKSDAPQLDDEQKVTIKYAVQFLLMTDKEHLIFQSDQKYCELAQDPAVRKQLEELNFLYGIFNKVRLRSDAKWNLIPLT